MGVSRAQIRVAAIIKLLVCEPLLESIRLFFYPALLTLLKLATFVIYNPTKATFDEAATSRFPKSTSGDL